MTGGDVKIGMMGATGPAGGGLAARLASVGYEVVAGSRDAARAEAALERFRQRWDGKVNNLEAGSNADAATADVVVIAVPWEATVATAQQHAAALSGKVVVAMANGVSKEGREFRPVVPEEGSIARAMQRAVPRARVVAAFQHIPAAALGQLDQPVESDVIVCADDDAARMIILELVAGIPNLRAFDGGSLANALGLETFAAVLLTINLRHKGRTSLRLLGVEARAPESS